MTFGGAVRLFVCFRGLSVLLCSCGGARRDLGVCTYLAPLLSFAVRRVCGICGCRLRRIFVCSVPLFMRYAFVPRSGNRFAFTALLPALHCAPPPLLATLAAERVMRPRGVRFSLAFRPLCGAYAYAPYAFVLAGGRAGGERQVQTFLSSLFSSSARRLASSSSFFLVR